MNIEEILRDKKLKITKQRKSILEIIIESENPISAETIFKMLEKKHNLDLSTVYRNLNTLEENKVLLKTTNLDGINYYQLNNKNHKHFITCTICHKKFVIKNCPVHELEKSIENETGFIINGHNFEFQGICPNCQEKIKSPATKE